MGYVDRVLQPDEQVIASTRIHGWFVWRRTVILLVLAIALALGALNETENTRTMLLDAAGAALVVGMLLAVGPAIERATTELAVTNRRVIHKRGFMQRHTIEMSRSQIESVDVDQSILGRLMNYGDVVVHGTGTTPEPFRFIADPLRFRSAITAS